MEKEKVAALPTTLRQKNYLAILNAFRGQEALCANDVSAMTGISRATVMKAIIHFTECGLLESAGKGDSTQIGGKRPELFRFCMKRYILCVGLQNNEMAVAVYDLKNILITKESMPYDRKEDATTFFDKLEKAAERLLAKVENGRELLYGVSLCIGGFLDTTAGILQYSVLTPEWGKDIPVRDMLQKRFPGKEIAIDNVARMAACAEVLDNPLYDDKRVAVIYTDIGASACYIDKGHILHGKNFMIGEIGMMILELSHMQSYTKGEDSFFSNLVSEKTLLRKVAEQPEKLKKSIMYEKKDTLKLIDIFQAADREDAFAKEIVRETAWIFSAVIQNIVVSFDPEVIILQGNFSRAGRWFDLCLKEGLSCFPRNMLSSTLEIKYDMRPVISLQMRGATKFMIRKFFQSEEWYIK